VQRRGNGYSEVAAIVNSPGRAGVSREMRDAVVVCDGGHVCTCMCMCMYVSSVGLFIEKLPSPSLKTGYIITALLRLKQPAFAVEVQGMTRRID
jgi:hypothetical protein